MSTRAGAGLVLLAVLAAAIWLRSEHMTDVTSRSPDERTYTAFASRLTEEGFGIYRELLANYARDPAQRVYPSPARLGNVLLFACVMRVTGVRDGRAGASVSWLLSILSVALVAWMGWRFFHPWVAVFASALMACSFTELSMARRAWQDTTFGFCGLLLVCLACEIGRRPRRKPFYAALFTVGAFALLTKETAALSYGLVLLWLAAVMAGRERSWRLAACVAATGAASLVAALAVWIGLAGDARIAVSAVAQAVYTGSGVWGQQNYSGPWVQFLYLLWLVGPLPAVAALAGFGVAVSLCLPRMSRLVARVDPFVAGLVAPVAWRAAALTAGVAIVLAGVHDYRSFTNVVVRTGMEDLSVSGIRYWMGR